MYRFMTNGIFQYMTSNNDLNEMKCLVDQKLRDVNKRMQATNIDEPENTIQIQGEEQAQTEDVDTNIRALQGQQKFHGDDVLCRWWR